MDSLLTSLGCELASEREMERIIYRDKVLNDVVYTGIGIPKADGAPRLTNHSYNKLLASIRAEIMDNMNGTNNIEKSLMKLRFVQSLIESNKDDDDDDNNDNNNNEDKITNQTSRRDELINELKTSNIKKSTKVMHGTFIPAHYEEKESKRNRLPFSKPSGSLNGLGLDKKTQMGGTYNVDWCIDDSLLQELSYEAKCHREKDESIMPLSPTLPTSPTSPTSPPSNDVFTNMTPVSEIRHKNKDNDDKTMKRKERSVAKVLKEKRQKPDKTKMKSKPVAKPSVSRRRGDTVSCPICMNDIETNGLDPNAVLDKHIDRCTRRGGINTSIIDNSSDDEDDDYDEIEENIDDDSSSELSPIKVNRRNKINEPLSEDSFDFSDTDDDDDDNDDNSEASDDRNYSNILKKKNGSKRQRKSNDKEVRPTLVNNGERGLMKEDKVTLDDDWEDYDYINRLENEGITRENEADIFVETGFGTTAFHSAWSQMHEYQKEGCRWMHGLYHDGVGGILGDEMGLGKTSQLCLHFGALGRIHRSSRTNDNECASFLIVCPATVLQHWVREMNKWEPTMRIAVLHNVSKTGSQLQRLDDRARETVIRHLKRSNKSRALTILTTYEGLRKHKECVLSIEWTGVCLDEGQKIRNPQAEVTRIAKLLPTFHRIILSGTPIQNTLKELWTLFDFVYPGRLGTLIAFEVEFATPIRVGAYTNANKVQKEVAVQTAAMLQRIIRPYLLRRRKDDLIMTTQLPSKTEQVLFCKLSRRQRDIYVDILNSDEVEAVVAKKTMSFRAVTTLRKLCNHPALVYHMGRIIWDESKEKAQQKKSNPNITAAEEESDDDDVEVNSSLLRSQDLVWSDSGKLLVLSKILPLWFNEGHKVLIFAQTQTMLNLIEVMIKELHFRYLRLDGSTAIPRRAGIVDTFNKDPTIFVILLTTRTGGVGISLTSANRVVLFDPDWNPQTDIQARERAWRLGQKRDVTIYRLISKGTIEEKIYQRQIFKVLLSNRILDNPKQKAMFSKADIHELFQLNDQDEHDIDDTNVKLPSEGKLDLSFSNCSTTKANDNIEEGEIEEKEERDYAIGDYVVQSQSTSETPAGKKDEPTASDRDKRLLQALFNGEAISSVYNHNIVEDSSSDIAIRQIQAEARRSVDHAVRQLQTSAPVYDNNVVAELIPVSSTSSSSSNRNSQPRFGNRTVSSIGTSSSTLLSTIRAQSSGNNDPSVGSSLSSITQVLPSTNSHSSSSSSSTTTRTSTSNTNDNKSKSASVQENLKRRLQLLFEDTNGRPLTTEYVLHKFSDLGDQYAAIFRTELRNIAQIKNGKWFKK